MALSQNGTPSTGLGRISAHKRAEPVAGHHTVNSNVKISSPSDLTQSCSGYDMTRSSLISVYFYEETYVSFE